MAILSKQRRPLLPRPVVGVSSCLLGQAVRYDGNDKRQPLLLRCLQPHVDWLPFCPEVAANLGIPRPPVHLVQDSPDEVRAVGVYDHSVDVTDVLTLTSNAHVEQLHSQPGLCGYIVKAHSPSCGLGSAALSDRDGSSLGATNGLFAAALQHHIADLVLVDEMALATEEACWRFLSACYLLFYRRFHYVPYPQLSHLLRQLQLEKQQIVELEVATKGTDKKAAPSTRLEQLFEFWRAVTPDDEIS